MFFTAEPAMDIIIVSSAFLALLIATWTDLKTREVPDYLNYGLLFFAIFLRCILALYQQSFIPLLEGILGFALGILIALLMFYLGQWGGGDSKMLIALSTLFGLPLNSIVQIFLDPFEILFSPLVLFIMNIFIAGAIYGVGWSIIIAVQHWRQVEKRYIYLVRMKSIRIIRYALYVLAIVLVFFSVALMRDTTFLLAFIVLTATGVLLLTFHLLLFIKSLEQSCMIRKTPIKKLTEGDWIPEDVVVKGKYITGPKELGITKEQIQRLLALQKKGLIQEVKVKIGIPFIPSFLLACILLLLFGNWFALII